MEYRSGSRSTDFLEGIAANLELAVTKANADDRDTITVLTYNLDAILDLLRQRKNASDYYRKSHELRGALGTPANPSHRDPAGNA